MAGVLGFVIVVALVLAARAVIGGEPARIRARLRAVPRRAIAAVADGQEARIVGRVVPVSVLTAPLTGRPCVYYEVTVDEYRSNRRGRRWRTIVHEVRGVGFALEDDTGRALIEIEGAQLAAVQDLELRSGAFHSATEAENALLERHGLRSQGWLLNKKLRYKEAVFAPGETVAALGRGMREPDPDVAATLQGYRDPGPTRLRLGRTERAPLQLSDHPATLR
jgi:hypothetical protein